MTTTSLAGPMPMCRLQDTISGILLDKNSTAVSRRKQVFTLMRNAFNQAGLSRTAGTVFCWYLKAAMTSIARKGGGLPDMEKVLRPMFRKRVNNSKVYYPNALARARRSFERIQPYLCGTRLLDLGAGNGLISQIIKQRTHMSVTLMDVIDYRMCDLPMVLYPQNGSLPLKDNSVDTTVIFLVLHHCPNPELLLREAARVTRRRMIVMEGYGDDPDIVMVNSFLDWFINRIAQGADIDVPVAYRTTGQWKRLFAENGFGIIEEKNVGIDEPIVPEYHVLFVAEKGT